MVTMNRLIATLSLAMLLLPAIPAEADISHKFGLTYTEPFNTDASESSKGNWGASLEMEFHLEGISDSISWGAGLDWVDMLGKTTYFQDAGGTPWIQELDQNYYRIWFGPRLRSHADTLFKPYAGAQIALIYYDYYTNYNRPGDEPTAVESDDQLIWGYGLHGGLEFRVSPSWSLDLGLKYLQTFGEPKQLRFESVTVHPSYLQYQLGVRFIDVP